MKLVQCWDDGVHDDIRVIEILRRHNARATFNLNFARHEEHRSGGWHHKDHEVFVLGRDELRSVYEGFLVANHGLTHPHLTQLAPEEAQRCISEGKDQLEQHFGYEVKGFAYPFGDWNEAVAAMVTGAGHSYGRTCHNVENCFPPENPAAFHSNCHFLNPEFWPRFETALAHNHAAFYFWGHSYEIIDEAGWAAFEAQIERLGQTPGTQWADLPELFQS